MAARAITKMVYLKPQALSLVSNRVFVSPGVIINRPLCSTPATVTTETPAATETTTTLAVIDTTREWRIQKFEEVAQTGIKLLQKFQKEGVELEEEDMSEAGVMLINSFKIVYALWEKTMDEQRQRLLQVGWECLRDFLSSKGLENCHRCLLLSINLSSGGGGKSIIEFATASPKKGITSLRRLVLQRLGPYKLPRQAVDKVVCITTKDAFLLYDPTTGDRSPWIETTTTRKGKARRQVESIALGFAPQSKRHKIVCISSYVKKNKFAPETEDRNELLVVEILTVRDNTWSTGDNEWRRLEGELPEAYELGERIAFLDGPVYFEGQIHWLFRHGRPNLYVLRFDVESEDFDYVDLPNFLIKEFMDSLRHVRLMLMEVDGKVAILKSTSDQETSTLCICHFLSKCSEGEIQLIKWTEEKVSVPLAYVCPGHSVEVLTDTDLIFIQSHRLISYYNRKTEESLSFKIPPSLRHRHFDWGRIIQL